MYTPPQIDTNKYQDKGKGKETEVGKGAERNVEWRKMVREVIGAHVVVMSPFIPYDGVY
jgi:hypothetical protein